MKITIEQINKQLKSSKGLTLIELLAVIVILGIIAAIAIPTIGGIIDNSRDKAELSTALNIINGAKLAVISGACEPQATTTVRCDNTNIGNYVESVDKNFYIWQNSSKEWNIQYQFALRKQRNGILVNASKATETQILGALK